MGAAEPDANAQVGADQRTARAQGRDRRDGGVARDHHGRGRREDPCLAREPGAAHEQGGASLPARPGCFACGRCGKRWSRARAAGGQRRYACAKGPGFSGCGKTYINADQVEAFVVEAVLHRLDSPELPRAVKRRQAQRPDASSVGRQEAEAAQEQLAELATAYGQREISMDEWKAARKPIEQQLSAARRQLAKVSRTNVLDGYVGNGEGLRAEWDSLDLSQQHAIVAAVVDSVVVGPARRGYNRFDESRLTPVWRP